VDEGGLGRREAAADEKQARFPCPAPTAIQAQQFGDAGCAAAAQSAAERVLQITLGGGDGGGRQVLEARGSDVVGEGGGGVGRFGHGLVPWILVG
jgi:hypothetical protein